MIQSWNRSGRTGQDRTKSSCGRTKPDFCRIFFDFFVGFFAGFLPDFCQCDVENEPDGFYRIFFDFFARFFVRFLPDFCQCDVKNEPDGIYRIFFDFFAGFFAGFFVGFLPDWRQKWSGRIFARLASKMIRPDFDRTGPDNFWSWPDRTGCKKSVRFQLWYDHICIYVKYTCQLTFAKQAIS